jgi:hypothetical protein
MPKNLTRSPARQRLPLHSPLTKSDPMPEPASVLEDNPVIFQTQIKVGASHNSRTHGKSESLHENVSLLTARTDDAQPHRSTGFRLIDHFDRFDVTQ